MEETNKIKAVILAAGKGSRLSPLTDNCPKSLLKVGGKTILERMLSHIRDVGINDVIIVLGHMEDQIKNYTKSHFSDLNLQFVTNYTYAATNTAYSLMIAEHLIGDSTFIKFDADVVFEKEILARLIACDPINYLCIDKNIALAAEEIKVILDNRGRILQANKSVDPAMAAGESIGIEKIDRQTTPLLFAGLRDMMRDHQYHQKYYESAYEGLIAKNTPFHTMDITGLKWVEIDTEEDLKAAEKLFGPPAV